MSFWEVKDRGFLSSQDPLACLSTKEDKYIPLVARLENIASVLPFWIEDRKVREELVCNLREISPLIDSNFLLNQDEAQTERLMHLFSFMASAYVFAEKEEQAHRIPTEISIPLTKVADKLSRKPIISYSTYCLLNWERIDKEEPIEFDNLKCLTSFSTDSEEESAGIAFNVDLENAAKDGVSSCVELTINKWNKSDNRHSIHVDTVKSIDILTKIYVSLVKMNKSLDKFVKWQKERDKDLSGIRPYAFSFADIVFEGCFYNRPITLKGYSVAQSCILPSFLIALDIYPDKEFPDYLGAENLYIPMAHRDFLFKLGSKIYEDNSQGLGLRAMAVGNVSLKEIYNDCLKEISKFVSGSSSYRAHYCWINKTGKLSEYEIL